MTGPHVDDGHGFVAAGILIVCVIPHFWWMWRSGFFGGDNASVIGDDGASLGAPSSTERDA